MAILAASLLVDVVGNTKGVEKDLDRVHNKIGRFSGVGTLAARGFVAMASGASAVVGYGIKVAGSLEQARYAFRSMLHSIAEGDKFFDKLRDFAVETPFEMPELIQGARNMMAMGIAARDVIPILEAVGNTLSARGRFSAGAINNITTALGVMNSRSVVQALEMRRIISHGIPAWKILADTIGKTIPETMELVTQKAISSTTFITAFQKYAAQNFGTAMQDQARTLFGFYNVMKDRVRLTLASMADPILEGLRTQFPLIERVVDDILKAIGPPMVEMTQSLISAFVAIVPAIMPTIGALTSAFAEILGALTPVLVSLTPTITYLATQFGVLVGYMSPLIPAIGQLIVALAPLVPSFTGLFVLLAHRLVPILVPMIEHWARIAEKLIGTEKAAGPLLKVLEALAFVIERTPAPVLEMAIQLFLLNRALTTVTLAVGAFRAGMGTIQLATKVSEMGALARVAHGLGSSITGMRNFGTTARLSFMYFRDGVAGVQGVSKGLSGAPKIFALLGRSIGFIGTAMKAAMAAFMSPAGLIIAAIVAIAVAGYLIYRNWDTIKRFLTKTWQAIANFAIRVWDSVFAFFRGLPGKIASFFTDLVPRLIRAWIMFELAVLRLLGRVLLSIGRWLLDLGATMIGAIPGILRAVLHFFIELPEMISYALGFVIGRVLRWGFELLKAFGTAIWWLVTHWLEFQVKFYTFIWNTFTNVLGIIWRFALRVPHYISVGFRMALTALGHVLGAIRSFIVRAWLNIITWLMVNIPRAYHAVVDWFSKLPGRVWEFVSSMSIKAGRGLSDLVGKFWDFLSGLPSKVGLWLSGLPGKIWEAVTGMYNKAKEVLGNIVQLFKDVAINIIKAIADLPGMLLDKAKDIGSSFVNGLKDGLGIHSPSLPERLTKQMALGIESNLTRATRSLNRFGATGLRLPSIAPVRIVGGQPTPILDHRPFPRPPGPDGGAGAGGTSRAYHFHLQDKPYTPAELMAEADWREKTAGV